MAALALRFVAVPLPPQPWRRRCCSSVLIVFTLMELVPGNCAERYLAFKNTQGQVDHRRGYRGRGNPPRAGPALPCALGGLDLGRVLPGELGESCILARWTWPADGRQVPDIIGLAGGALVLAYLIAMPVGIIRPLRATRWLNGSLRFVSYLGLAMPNFLLALMIMLLSTIWFGDTLTGLFSTSSATRRGPGPGSRISCRNAWLAHLHPRLVGHGDRRSRPCAR
jgi:ABC-type dipeptide/oligopeptide/nickel transport system permease component